MGSPIGLGSDPGIGDFWTNQPEQIYLNTSRENPIPSVVVSEGIFVRFDYFHGDQFLGKPTIDSVIVHATTCRICFIASLDTWTSRLGFIHWEWANKMLRLTIWIDSGHFICLTAFWASASTHFAFLYDNPLSMFCVQTDQTRPSKFRIDFPPSWIGSPLRSPTIIYIIMNTELVS
jgi:hypothetical protein